MTTEIDKFVSEHAIIVHDGTTAQHFFSRVKVSDIPSYGQQYTTITKTQSILKNLVFDIDLLWMFPVLSECYKTSTAVTEQRYDLKYSM